MEQNQSMAIFGDYAIFICHYKGLMGELFNIKKKEYISSISLPYVPFKMPHANTSCFGKSFLNENSILPLLYVSSFDEDSDRGCFVYDISQDGGVIKASLTQRIIPVISSKEIGSGALDWVVDYDSNYIYSIAYNKGGQERRFSWENEIIITKFKLPDIKIRGEVYFTEKDIIQSSRFDNMPINQDKCYKDGLLFIVSGGADINNVCMNRLRIISLNPLKLIDDLDIALFGIKEPEGLDFYGNQLLINYNDGNPEKIWMINI